MAGALPKNRNLLGKMRVDRRNVRGDDGRLAPRWFVGCGGCDASLDFDGKKNVQTEHLGHMVRGKGWTWDKAGGTCPKCQGKGKTADVIQLPGTTNAEMAQRIKVHEIAGRTMLIDPRPSPADTAAKAERDAAFWRGVRDGTIPNPYLAAEEPRARWGRSNDPAFHEEIRPFIEDGYNDHDIAELVGCSHDLISRTRQVMGVPNSRTIRKMRKGMTDMGEVRPMNPTPPQSQTAPLIPNVRETVAIVEKLEGLYSPQASRYIAPWTDQKVGEALSLPAAKVAHVRRELYGEMKGDPELHAIRDEIAAVQKMLDELRQRLDRAERKAAEGNIR